MEDRRRVFGPRSRDFPGRDVVKQERSQLLAVIHDCYEAARTQHRLPAEATGYCLGLLDSVSSLAINITLVSSGEKAADDLERRSLDGMVVFLTTFFPGSPIGKPTALKCAAMAAAHPDPDSLVDAWLALSPCLDHAVTLLAATTPTAALLRGLADGAAGDIDMVRAWELAAYRQQDITGSDDDVPLYHHTRSLRRALIDKIHRLYLQVLARLPRSELRCRYHRALLATGSCYGPCSDPGSNVVLNTVWYDTMFPTRRDQLELDVLTTSVLGRVACRSLCGLVSFLCTRYGDGLSEHDAIRRLLDADADLHAAARDAERRGHRPCSSIREAYEAAATAAWHPYETEQAAFLDSGFEDAVALLPAPHELITSENIVRLAEQLSPVPAPQPVPPRRGTKLYWAIIRLRRRRFRTHEGLILSLVKAALAEQDDGDGYELHVICGVSECIIDPGFMPETEDVVYHVNFLARRQQGPPALFFAECSKKGPATLRRLVDMPPPRASLVRCMHCEEEGGKIIHPASAEFHGREKEFELAARGTFSLSNRDIIGRSEIAGQPMSPQLREDAIYEDSDGASSDDDDDILAEADYDDDMFFFR
ncbi:hypothetical protein QYE76_009944 [Lolium multiflorum]|uniref:Uncharacterized protein n=1 Tax=Lolium multiflorum TaxID=4521 RepID=A0AAD8TUM5_LOLMU|nr:hypothetical protein QYE76_009944 [Lolium multiflorum]